MKILEIDECRLCPFRVVIREVDDYRYECGKAFHKTIADMFTIPVWCPLPDKSEVKK
jgi:hypothetical protein